MTLMSSLPSRLRRVTEGGAYRPEIDGLRFWAILPVVAWHSIQRVARAQPTLSPSERAQMLWVPEGWTGVVLFFCISGFIISSQFARRRKEGRKISLGAYFYRRVTRIEPPYLILLFSTFVVVQGFGYRPQNTLSFDKSHLAFGPSLLASVFYVHGLVFNEMPRLFLGGWSLEIEVQFYVLAPLILAAFYRAKAARARLMLGAAILIAALVVSRIADQVQGYGGWHRYTLIKYFGYFWLGVLLSEVSVEGLWPRLSVKAWDVAGFAGLILYLLSGVAQHEASFGFDSLTLDGARVFCFAGLFGAAVNGGAFRRLCSLPWIALIGGACYSIYLSHVQTLQVIAPLVAKWLHPPTLGWAAIEALAVELPIVLTVGLIVYTFVERPFMTPDWPKKVLVAARLHSGARRLRPGGPERAP